MPGNRLHETIGVHCRSSWPRSRRRRRLRRPKPGRRRPCGFIVPLPPGSGMDLVGAACCRAAGRALGPAGGGGEPPGRRRHPGGDRVPVARATITPSCSRSPGIVTFNHLLHERLPYDPKELRADRAGDRQFSRRLRHRHAEGGHARRSGEGREGAARQAQLGGDAGPALSTSCSRCRGTPASRWRRWPIATSRPPTRTSTRAGCMSPAPACRRWCRITAPAPPSSCS